MATAAFRSSTRRSSGIGAAETPRRARSLSRAPPERSGEVARGRFVNTERGSGFSEVSLEELATEFASGGMPWETMDGEEEQRGRRRLSDAGFAMETESSRRRGRSVSRKGGGGKQGREVGEGGNSRRMRSLSVARYHRSRDLEGEVDLHSLSNKSKSNNAANTSCRQPSFLKSNASTPMRRNYSKHDFQLSHDSCSSQSSSITDDEGQGVHCNRSTTSKKTRAVFGQKQKLEKKNPMLLSEEEEFQMVSCDATKTITEIRKNYIQRLEESEKRKQELLAELAAEEHRGQQLSKIVQGLLPVANRSTKGERQSRGKRTNEKTRMSRQLTEEAEKYLEDFIVNIEDTDLSSFDGERSDTSSTIGGSAKLSDAPVHAAFAESQGHTLNAVPSPVESDGVRFPWLQWGICEDSSLLPKDKIDSASASTDNMQNAVWENSVFVHQQQQASPCDRSCPHACNRDSCSSPDIGVASVSSKAKQVGSLPQINDNMDKFSQTRGIMPCIGLDSCLNKHKNETTLFEAFRQRQRIESGGLLICGASFRKSYIL